MTKDPVCGMSVDEKTAGATATQDGKTYYFCGAACKDKFVKNPKQYVGKKKGSPPESVRTPAGRRGK